ncbi:hypothetical protein [Actinomycetospora sp. NBRC 106378]|uniref:hypothetical protein n=1 Tax=Actinomycetospora sp. NBRC 106378 TaxID=3032208 RepID=UPI0025544C2A|nr:hypothetical protein [Actinomycetospora sp. NBRC 106378]
MRARIWVAVLHVSDRVREKITNRHGIEEQELRDEVECIPGLRATWDDSPDRGRRAIVEIRLRRQRVLVVLYPTGIDPDEFHLGSAYPVHD